ncbi:MAG: cytochrome d ubiquinol oxidase subunit II [Alphaproteobacteria bacterium]|nr:cytochrome d ubiquinol oxidase subunit II [Alphaproteobacteria bacterium]
MILDYEILKLIWWALVGILLIGFAITDGMDMGVGTLLPFLGRTDGERRVIINAVAPHWDGNQVWLITAGGAIFAAWPAVYAASFSGFYLAMLLVLIALFFRPVGFDYRSKLTDKSWRTAWDWGLFAGGFIPALIFGVAFGNLIQGVPFHLDEFLRPHFDAQFLWALIILLNPFALLAGLISVAMLATHGGIWLQLRTERTIAERSKPVVKYLAIFTSVAFALAGIWVAFGIEGYRVVSMPPIDALPNPLGKEVVRETGALLAIYANYPVAILAPLLGLAMPLVAWYLSENDSPGWGFVMSGLGLAGIISTAGLSMFPFIMPSSSDPNSSLIVWDATSSHLTLTVMFWAVVVFLPIVLAYTVWAYWRMWRRMSVADIEARAHEVY